MKRFEYESTVTQMDEVFEYSKSNDISEASKKELQHFLSVLKRHFSTIETGNCRYQSYQGAVQYIESLIVSKSPRKSWYEKPIGLIGIGLFITIIGGLFVAKFSN